MIASSGAGTLKYHLQHEHKMSFTPSSSSSSSSFSSSPRKRKLTSVASDNDTGNKHKQVSLVEGFAASYNAQLSTRLIHFLAACSLPHSIVDHPAFRHLCDTIKFSTTKLPCRKSVRALLIEEADRMRTRLIAELSKPKLPVSVAIDGWTNVRHSKITNIVPISMGKAYYWCSLCNNSDKNDADWLFNATYPQLQQLIDNNVPVVALVADNESVNNALYSRLKEKLPFLIRVPCAAHTIQLMVKDILKIPTFAATVQESLQLIALFDKKENRNKLNVVQSAEETRYAIVKPNDTRWSSTLYALQRLLLLKSYINVVEYKSEAYWNAVAHLSKLLKPFQVATDIIQRDCATLYDTYQQCITLLSQLHNLRDDFDAGLISNCCSIIQQRWKKQVNQPATIAAAILSFSSAVKSIPDDVQEEARSFVCKFGAQYLYYYKHTQHMKEAEGILMQQMSHFHGNRERFCTLQENINMIRTVSTNQYTMALDVWDQYSMELATVAKAIISIPASEAAVERTFSAQSTIHSKKRNLLTDEAVQAELFVKFNGVALGDIDQPKRYGIVELNVDYEPPVNCAAELFAAAEEEEEADEENYLEDAASEEEEQKMDVVDDASFDVAASSQHVMRSQSEINRDNHQFLLDFIRDNKMEKGMRWTSDKKLALEAAAVSDNIGGYSTTAMIKQINWILNQS